MDFYSSKQIKPPSLLDFITLAIWISLCWAIVLQWVSVCHSVVVHTNVKVKNSAIWLHILLYILRHLNVSFLKCLACDLGTWNLIRGVQHVNTPFHLWPPSMYVLTPLSVLWMLSTEAICAVGYSEDFKHNFSLHVARYWKLIIIKSIKNLPVFMEE